MTVYHECQRCTACCRWPGEVRLRSDEITRLTGFLGLSDYDFTERYTRLAQDRRGLVLAEKQDGECIFLNGIECAVQPVKPRQCRDFPDLWNTPGFEKVCQAIPRAVSESEYRRLVSHHETG